MIRKITDKYLIVSLSLLAIEVVLTIYAYSILPSIIPTHFNGSDIPNGYGDKSYIFLFLGINVFLFALLSGLILLFRNHSDLRLIALLQLIRITVPLSGIGVIAQTVALVQHHISLKYISDAPILLVIIYAIWQRKTFFKPQ